LGAKNVEVVPNGVDTSFFTPGDYAATQPYLLYTGLMSYEPNVGAVRHFVAEVLPLIRQEIPNAAFHIVGARPTEEVQALASESVIVHGSVPDMRPYFDAAMAVVVPLLEGGGTRLKILEAAASGKAIVSTSLGAEGLSLRHDEDLLIADSALEFAAAVIRLCKDAGLRWRLGQQARSASLEYDWKRIGARFRRVVESFRQEMSSQHGQ
jgi:glycosyltransferase involved in cell wall biosynthesis